MAAAGYMTELDTESIWAAVLDTDRFDDVNIRFAEILNFRIYKDSTRQCANTGCTPILEQISEETLIELIAASKIAVVHDPWDFIAANVGEFMNRKLHQWNEFLDDIQTVEGKRHNIKQTSKLTLPSHSD